MNNQCNKVTLSIRRRLSLSIDVFQNNKTKTRFRMLKLLFFISTWQLPLGLENL